MNTNERTIALIGNENLEILKQKNIIIFGVGGVGGYVAEMLARCSIESLTLVDFDVVSESNINRQIIATTNTVGMLKVDCFKQRIALINPKCKVQTFAVKIDASNVSSFNLEQYDYVVDCIDMLSSKVALIKHCNENNIKIISSMGAGNRYQVPKFEICDISKTENDGLARALRIALRKIGINHTMVCYTNQTAKKQKIIGSIAYFPAMAGINIAAWLINQFIGDNENGN